TPVWALSSRFVDAKRSVKALVTTFRTIWRTAGVPSTSFVCPSNCGSGRRTVSTAVRPAMTSSFSSFSVCPTFRRRALSATCVCGEAVDELGDAALVVELLDGRRLPAEVLDRDREPRHEEGRLPRPRGEIGQGELRVADEDLPVGPVAHPGAGAAARSLADDAQLAAGDERLERRVRRWRGTGGVREDAGLTAVGGHRV